ncbi:unnamed protein product, partial [Brenthis ino]
MHNDETKTRRKFVIASINTSLKDTLANSEADKFLFGDNMSEKLKTAKTVQRSAEALKVTQAPFSRANFSNNKSFNSNNNLNYKPLHQKTTGRQHAGRPYAVLPPRHQNSSSQRQTHWMQWPPSPPPPSSHQPPPPIRRTKPSQPKYSITWDPSIVLNYLSAQWPHEGLDLEILSKKVITLLALVTAHRVQTLALIKIPNIEIMAKNTLSKAQIENYLMIPIGSEDEQDSSGAESDDDIAVIRSTINKLCETDTDDDEQFVSPNRYEFTAPLSGSCGGDMQQPISSISGSIPAIPSTSGATTSRTRQ